MSFKISYDSDQISGVVQGYGGMIQAKKEVKKLRDGLSGLSFIATVNNKDVTDKLWNYERISKVRGTKRLLQ